jgi:hypothetical protein
MHRKIRFVFLMGIAVAALAGITCSSKSSNPSSPTPTTTITTPVVVSPAQGAQLGDLTQPITLTVQNATTTGANPLTYNFEVATDSQFASKVYTRSGVTPGTGGQTSQQIDRLTAGQSYFWRARAEDLASVIVSGWGSAGFSIGPGVRFDAPVASEPLNGDRAGGARPLLRARNSPRDASVGAVNYTFEVAETADFQTVLATGTVGEGAGGYSGITEWRVTKDLTAKTYYWRVKGVASAGSSPYMTAAAFVPWPDEIDASTVTYLHGPSIANWPLTRTLKSVTQGTPEPDMICTFFTRQGNGDWPPVDFYGEGAELGTFVEGTQWYFAKIGGKWYAVAGEWFRPGQTCKSGQLAQDIGRDATQEEPIHSWVPKVGELVGYAVSGPARNYPQMQGKDERSQIILIPWK